jgi:hypothetical protein
MTMSRHTVSQGVKARGGVEGNQRLASRSRMGTLGALGHWGVGAADGEGGDCPAAHRQTQSIQPTNHPRSHVRARPIAAIGTIPSSRHS